MIDLETPALVVQRSATLLLQFELMQHGFSLMPTPIEALREQESFSNVSRRALGKMQLQFNPHSEQKVFFVVLRNHPRGLV